MAIKKVLLLVAVASLLAGGTAKPVDLIEKVVDLVPKPTAVLSDSLVNNNQVGTNTTAVNVNSLQANTSAADVKTLTAEQRAQVFFNQLGGIFMDAKDIFNDFQNNRMSLSTFNRMASVATRLAALATIDVSASFDSNVTLGGNNWTLHGEANGTA